MYIKSQDKTRIIPLYNYTLEIYPHDVFAYKIIAHNKQRKLLMGVYLYKQQIDQIMNDIRNAIINVEKIYKMPKIKMSLWE